MGRAADKPGSAGIGAKEALKCVHLFEGRHTGSRVLGSQLAVRCDLLSGRPPGSGLFSPAVVESLSPLSMYTRGWHSGEAPTSSIALPMTAL